MSHLLGLIDEQNLDALRSSIVCAFVKTWNGCPWGSGDDPIRLVAALLFYLSDLAVARERFVAPGRTNRLWGLPTYYVAQILFALSIGSLPVG